MLETLLMAPAVPSWPQCGPYQPRCCSHALACRNALILKHASVVLMTLEYVQCRRAEQPGVRSQGRDVWDA